MTENFIIVGASHAASMLAPSLRQQGWQGRILVVGAEASIPYHRPPLSKDYLAGAKTLDEILIRPAKVYEKSEVEFILNTSVESIDRDNKTVRLSNNETLSYDKLALTVGSKVRKVNLSGVDLDGVFYLRDLRDVERITPYINPGANAVIVGGGYIGLETAAVLNKKGMNVTVLEMMERVLQRVTAPVVSEFYTRIHEEEGVSIRCGVGVSGFQGNGRVAKVLCSDGSGFAADLVIIGVGILPNTALAEAAGLEVDNGIVVNDRAQTSDPDIFAAGDCTNHHNPIYDRRIRLESVQNATDQSRVAAGAACGKEVSYNAVPWFWSEQYDLMLQIAGLSQGYDEIITRGDPGNGRSFAAFYLREGRVIAVDAVNKPQEFMFSKKLIPLQKTVDKKRLADAGTPIKELL
ncbi:MAG: FAD-dependent oxidoreductase [Gammaproteobacteria bacterium]|nr:FAD-dependent oxidoreductase [Gammaproteobacteria bacterium]